MTNHRSELLDVCIHAEHLQQAYAVRLHLDAHPHGLPEWAPLHELRPEVLLSPSMSPSTISMPFHTIMFPSECVTQPSSL